MPLAPEPWDQEKDSNALSPLVDPYAGFGIIPGNPLIEKPSILEVPGASWRDGASGNLVELLSDRNAFTPTKDYNVYDDIPERHFDPAYLKYYVNSMSKEQTESISMKVDKEERDNQIRE